MRLNVTDYFANRQSSMLIGLEGLTVAAAAAPAPKIEKAGAAAMVRLRRESASSVTDQQQQQNRLLRLHLDVVEKLAGLAARKAPPDTLPK